MVIDCHAHIFPWLGGACGWDSQHEHVEYLKKCMYAAAHPRHVAEPEFWKSELAIEFRVGKYGRMEWIEDGVQYFRQFMPPSLQEQTAPPELLVVQMEHVGVDFAILQSCKLYGKLNQYFAEAIREFPDWFAGTGQIDEFRAHEQDEREQLQYISSELGFTAIFFEATRFVEIGDPTGFANRQLDPFWREVNDLGMAVLFNFNVSKAHYIPQMRACAEVAARFPDISFLVTMGFCVRPFIENGRVVYPQELFDIFKKPNLFAEVVYPIQAGPVGWEYPFTEANELLRRQYGELGGHKLCWGSDMPNVERNCTYRQCLDHVKEHCGFIGNEDLELILGGNIARIMNIDTVSKERSRPVRADVP